MSPRGTRPSPGGGATGPRRRTAAEFDALLDGGSSGDLQLDRVLSAARGPGRAHELAVPAPAVGVYPPAEARSRTRQVLTRLGAATLVTKAVTAAVGAAVVGAAAVAGATHHLPGQHRQHAPTTVTPSTTGEPSGSGPRSDAPSSGKPTTSGSSSASTSASTSPSGSSGATGAADIPTLCRVWLTLPPGLDAVRQEPRFRVLIQTAGGAQAVTAYCRTLPTQSASESLSGSGTVSTSPATSSSGTTSSKRTTATSTRSPDRTQR